MADGPIDYVNFAGRLVFPKTPTDLADTTKCPACFSILRGSMVCPSCRLDLNHPAAVELHETSVRAADTILERARIIGRMRYETDQLLAQRAAGTVVAPATAAAVAPPATTVPAPVEPVNTAAATATPAPIEPAPVGSAHPATSPAGSPAAPAVAPASVDRPRRSSVQVTLLIVGVSLLSIAAIFFLIYAFIVFGLVWRSVIVGAITVAAIVAASMLRGRNLASTAEGIAVFGVVLVYLDAWALKANNMFGLDGVDGTLYWGIVLTLSTIGFAFWHRRTLLRAPNIAAFAALAPGFGLLAAGLASDADSTRQAFIGFAAAGIAGMAHVATRHRKFERTVLLIASLVAIVIAGGFGFQLTANTKEGPFALAIAAVVGILVLAGLVRSRTSRVFEVLFGLVAGFIAASVSLTSIAIIDNSDVTIVATIVGASLVTLVAEHLFRRAATQSSRRAIGWTTIGAAVFTAIPAASALFVIAHASLSTAGLGMSAGWQREADAMLPAPSSWFLYTNAAPFIIAIGLTAVLFAVSGVLNKTSPICFPVALWAASAAAIGAATLPLRLDAVVSAWLVLATLALATLLFLRPRDAVGARYRIPLAALAAASSILALVLSWANRDLWWTTTLVVIALLLFSRILTRTEPARAGLLGTSATLALASAGSVANRLNVDFNAGLHGTIVNYVTFTAIAAVVLIVLSAIRLPTKWSSLDRRVLFWIGFAGAVLAFGSRATSMVGIPIDTLSALLLPEWLTSLLLALALLTGLALWVFLPTNKPLRTERIAASIAATPALYLVVTAFTRALGLPATLDAIAPISAALLGAAASLALTVTRPSSVPRWAREVGIAIVAVPALVGALRTDTGLAWLALVLASVTALLLAIDKTGLFTSASPRRHYGWLALALGTAGLWWRLRGDHVTALEPYVLPLAAALIIIALLIARASRSAPSLTAPAIALAGALVALVPLGLNGATGVLERPVIVAAASAVLLLVGSFMVASRSWQRWLDAAALAGAIGLIVTVVGRALPTRDPVVVDAWVAALFVVLFAAAFGQARTRADDRSTASWRTTAGVTLAIAAMTVVLLLETPHFDLRLGTVRAMAVLLLFALVHLIAFIADIKPLTPLVGWVAIAFTTIVGIVGTITDVLDPLELATVPIAVALLTTGAHQLATVPTARSWPWLAPGLIVLLVPSLLATATVSPLWRLVALGIVAIAVLIIGAVKRMQAPFVIGAVVVLWHGIATLQPQLRAVYEAVPWWLWLGIGGVLLIVLAARYEKRIANFKSVAMKFGALR